MPRHSSEHFVDRTSELLREQCGKDVTLSMVLDACDAQKGSLYHFFPGGKEELLVAAVEKMGSCALTHIQQCISESETAAKAIQLHLQHLVKLLEQPDSPVGMPFLALAATVGTTHEGVRVACENAITNIEAIYSRQLVKDGYSSKQAKEMASFTVLAVDGAILLARSRGNSKPIHLASRMLSELLSQR